MDNAADWQALVIWWQMMMACNASHDQQVSEHTVNGHTAHADPCPPLHYHHLVVLMLLQWPAHVLN